MKPGAFPLAACALLAALPAQAQRKRAPSTPMPEIVMPPAPETPFTVYRNSKGCLAGDPMGGAAGPSITVGLDLDGAGWFRITGRDWRFEIGKTYRIGIRPLHPGPNALALGDRDQAVIETLGFRDNHGRFGITATGRTVLVPFAYAIAVALYREGAQEPFARVSNPYGPNFAEFRRCLTEAAKEDRGSGEPPATPAAPRGSPANFVSNDDYPAAALRAGHQGRSAVRLTISAHGIPSACAVTESSGTPLLDTHTCALMMRRGRFTAALDAAGRPTEGSVDLGLRWVLPADDPPPTK
jgi:TonB family protein